MRIIGIVLMVVGAILLLMGVNESDSFASELSEFFTGNPTDRAIWLMLGGVAALVVGLGATFAPAWMKDKR
jgi:drug/metabolite transporter (DMT)-like permease